jgi:hypothetical protein
MSSFCVWQLLEIIYTRFNFTPLNYLWLFLTRHAICVGFIGSICRLEGVVRDN